MRKEREQTFVSEMNLLGTAANNPHIFLTEPLAFKAYTATDIFETWVYDYINIYI